MDLKNTNGIIYIHTYEDKSKFMDLIRNIINDINNKEIKNYYPKYIINVYASKDNIEKLKQNIYIQYEKRNRLEIENLYKENGILENQISELESKLEERESTIELQKEELETKDIKIQELEEELNN